MTPEEFKKEMQVVSGNSDTESAHGTADDLLCEVLRSLGYGEGVAVFENMKKWYA